MDPSWVQQLLPPAASGKEDLSSRAPKAAFEAFGRAYFFECQHQHQESFFDPGENLPFRSTPSARMPGCQ